MDSKRIAGLKNELADKTFSEQVPILLDIAYIYLSENTDSTIHYMNYLDNRVSERSEYKVRLELLKIRQSVYAFDFSTSKKQFRNFEIKYLEMCTEEEYIDFKYLEAMYSSEIDIDKAFEIINNVLEKYGHLNLDRIADFHILKSNQLNFLSRYSESIKSLEKALLIFRKLNNDLQIARTYMILSFRYISLKDYPSAYTAIQKAIGLKSEDKSKSQIIDEQMALGEIFYHQSKFKEAIEVFEFIEKENKTLGYLDIYNNSFYLKNACLHQLGQFDQVIENCLNQLDKDYFIEDHRFTINYLLILNYNELKKFKEAKVYVDETMEFIKNFPKYLPEIDFLDFMKISIQTEKGLGNINEALKLSEEYIKKYHEYKDSIDYVKIAASHTSFELKEKEIELKDFQIKATSDALKLEKLNNERLLLWIFLISGSILTSGVLLFMKRMSNTNKKLSQQNVVIEESKKRIELLLTELHHRTKNNLQLILSMLKIQARNNKYIDVNEFIQVNSNRINSMAMIHQYLYLNDTSNDKISLKNYTEDLVNAIKSTFADKDHVEIQFKSKNVTCDINIAVAIGLIINELFTNSLKYAFLESDKGKIRIHIDVLESGMIQLDYKDDGVGFKTSEVKSGSFGVSLVNLLIAQIQGIIRFENNHGVHYQFDIPVTTPE
jgi:two-component sensor histidine kinase